MNSNKLSYYVNCFKASFKKYSKFYDCASENLCNSESSTCRALVSALNHMMPRVRNLTNVMAKQNTFQISLNN